MLVSPQERSLAARVAFLVGATAFALSSCNCDEELTSTPGSLRGVVCATANGQPLAGVAVTIRDGAGVETPAVSDGFGQFFGTNLVVGNGTVIVSEPGEAPRELAVEITSATEAEVIDSTCHPPVPPPPPPSGTVTGCVCDAAAGQWVVGANVFVLTDDGGVVVTGTDADGCFVLEGVPEGAHTVTVEKTLFAVNHEVTIVAGETTAIPSPATCELDPPPPPGEVGIVEGRVCAPDGDTFLAGADAFVNLTGGGRVGDVTDADGRYRIENVPVGAQTVQIVKGSFSTTVSVTVAAGQTTVVPEEECAIEAVDLRIAVVTGDYDRVQDVLTSIGIRAENIDTFSSSWASFDDEWVDTLLSDYATLSQYDIVFLNCGVGDLGFTARFFGVNDPIVGENLRRFVSEGGSVYASDWAYTVVEKTWPDFIDFRGDDADLPATQAKVGIEADDIIASIVDIDLAGALGSSTMTLHYPLAAWVVMESVVPSATVYVQGDAQVSEAAGVSNLSDVPHTVAFRPGSGRVLYTSFHQEPGINPEMERVLQLLIFEL